MFPNFEVLRNFGQFVKPNTVLEKKTAKNLRGFRAIWTQISREVRKSSGKEIMKHAWTLLRDTGYKGVRQAPLNSNNN